jgi:hypothetical protein
MLISNPLEATSLLVLDRLFMGLMAELFLLALPLVPSLI